MITGPIYIVHPSELRFPDLSSWKSDIGGVVSADEDWAEYPIAWLSMRDDSTFQVTDVLSRVGSQLGAVFIFEKAAFKLRQEVRERLAGKTVVMVEQPLDSTELWVRLCELREMFASGEPMLPRRLVATVLIVRKLYSHDYWGGANEKNFLWGDELAKGRGVDDSYKDIAQDVANYLRLKGLLQVKYGGKGTKGQKYALSPSCKGELVALANECQILSADVRQWCWKDRNLVSARELDGWKPVR